MPFDWLVVVNFLTNFFRFFLKFAPGPAHINIVCNVLMWNYGWIFWFLFGLVVNILCFSCDLGQIWKPGYNWFGFENLWVCKDPKGVLICHLLWLKINIVSDRKRPQESKGMFGNCFFPLFFVFKNNFLFLKLKNLFSNSKWVENKNCFQNSICERNWKHAKDCFQFLIFKSQ